jgi:hypothetical protein
MINVIKMSMTDSDIVGEAVRRLAHERPDWIPVLEAAASVAAESEPYGRFPGKAVLDELSARGGPRWFPNLRILVGYGLVEKVGATTRSGRRAYYRMPHRLEIERALEELRPSGGRPRVLRLVASGASSEKSDLARRAGEIEYEPRSWR